MNIQKNCLACGDLITVRLCDHRRGWGKFCGKACAAAYKCGQRPGDVNEGHAKHSFWAADRMSHFKEAFVGGKPPKAVSIKDQIGRKARVVPTYHSPSHCRECGSRINGPGLCDTCFDHLDSMNCLEEGWDGHKA